MDTKQAERLAADLLHADDEQTVIAVLKNAKLWDDPAVWRLYGDRDSNFNTIGNQQSRPEAALSEKIVNGVDARLMNECLLRGIDPESPKAPSSLREAIARFIEGKDVVGELDGQLAEWGLPMVQQQEQFITLAVTGKNPRAGSPCLTLVDQGEGQTPEAMPDTFLSIDKGNKLKIPFVQGKFNMGGTGALKFCGTQKLQLIISKRNPAILKKWTGNKRWGSKDQRSHEWGFTIVRREKPSGLPGTVRNSVYKFLAPVGAKNRPGKGDVLSFSARAIDALPENNVPYAKPLSCGSIIKLYEYDVKGFGSHALMPDGLLNRLELLLPQVALPVRVHECRSSYKGDPKRSFANTLKGVVARLTDNKNLEEGYPASLSITVHQEKFRAKVYALTGNNADTYRKNEGIIFSINGQTHGAIPKTFFDRAKVKMGRLARSLLIMVDCSDLSVTAREDLFMNSRDRLSNGELRKAVEDELEEAIGKHPGLRALREKRRAEEIANRLAESKPLENVLDSIIKSSPTLTKLFLAGQRLSRPHKGNGASDEEGGGSGGETGAAKFVGKPHPSFFRFHGLKDSETQSRSSELGRRCRFRFDTDVENGYFERAAVPGRYDVEVIDGPLDGTALDNNITLFNGIANWSVSLPEDQLNVGDELTLQFTVTDDTLIDPLVNVGRVRIIALAKREGVGGERKERTATGDGEGGVGPGGSGGKGHSPGSTTPGGIKIPPIYEVEANSEDWKKHEFSEHSACKVIDDGGDDEAQPQLSFYINVDNISLRTEMKNGADDVDLIKKKFIWGNVLVGLSLIHDERQHQRPKSEDNGDGQTVYQLIDRTTRALAPFLVPMIDYLGALSSEEELALAQKGDDE